MSFGNYNAFTNFVTLTNHPCVLDRLIDCMIAFVACSKKKKKEKKVNKMKAMKEYALQ